MKKGYVAWMVLLALVVLAGCSNKSTKISFDSNAEDGGVSVLVLKADGSTLTTDTDQAADGTLDMSGLIKAAKDAVGKKASTVIDRIKNVLGGDDDNTEAEAESETGAAVSPAGTIEEVE